MMSKLTRQRLEVCGKLKKLRISEAKNQRDK